MLEYGAFRDSSIREITIPDNIIEFKETIFCDAHSLEKINGGINLLDISYYCFYNCRSLKQLNLPKVKTVQQRALYGLDAITSLTLLCVESLSGYDIWHCPNLKELNLGNKLRTIGHNCFEFCDSLRSITFPKTLLSIGNDSIYGNSSMEYIRFLSEEPPGLGNTNIFKGQSYNYPIYVPDASLSAYKSADKWNTYANRIRPMSEFRE